jgi:hypothetical protein
LLHLEFTREYKNKLYKLLNSKEMRDKMSRLFSKEIVNKGRQIELDITRGLSSEFCQRFYSIPNSMAAYWLSGILNKWYKPAVIR